MRSEKRIYDALLAEHLTKHRQMAFVTGPRQVGKTTTCRDHADPMPTGTTSTTANRFWRARHVWSSGSSWTGCPKPRPAVLFDELHKYPRWKQLPERVLRHLRRSGSNHRDGQQSHGRLSSRRRQPDGPLLPLPDAPVLRRRDRCTRIFPTRANRPAAHGGQGGRLRGALEARRLPGAVSQARHAIQSSLAVAAPRNSSSGRISAT